MPILKRASDAKGAEHLDDSWHNVPWLAHFRPNVGGRGSGGTYSVYGVGQIFAVRRTWWC